MVNLAEYIEQGKLDAEIVTVISSRSNVAGVERAKELRCEPHIIRVKDFPDVEEFSSQIAGILNEAKVDLVCQCGWLCYWKIPDRHENKVLNIHPALLPAFGGKGMWGHHVHEAVLKKGCKVSGCTVHLVTNEYDVGPILVQRTCPVLDDDDADTLADRVFREECLAYPEAIQLIANDRVIVRDGRVFRKN